MNRKQTSKSVAIKASQILRDGRYGSKAKSVAGSALAQTKTERRNNTFQTKGSDGSLLINLPVPSGEQQQNSFVRTFRIQSK